MIGRLRSVAVFGLFLCSLAACADSAPAIVPTALPTVAAVTAPATLPTAASATEQPAARATAIELLATAVPQLVVAQTVAPPIATPTALPRFPTHAIDENTLGELRLLRTVGFGGAQSAAVAPDGTLLAVGTTAGLALFDVPGLRPLRFDAVEGGAGQIAFSPDGAILAVAHSTEITTTLRRIGDGHTLADVAGAAPQFSPDGQVVATLSDAGTRQPTTRLWGTRDGMQLAQIAGVVVAFSPHGGFLATRDSQYLDPLASIQVRGANGAWLFELAGRFAAFNPAGTLVAIAGETSIELRRIPAGELVSTLNTTATAHVWGLAFSADGRQLFVVADAAIETWDVANAQRLRSVPSGLEGQPSGEGLFAPGDTVVALPFSVGDGAGARLVRIADGTLVHEDLPWQVDVTFDAAGQLAALVNSDLFSNGRVRLVDLRDGKTSDLDLHSYQNVGFSPDAQILAISDGRQVQLMRATDGGLLRTLPVEDGPIAGTDTRLQFSPDGTIVSLSGNLNVPYGGPLYGAAAWDPATGQPVDVPVPAGPPFATLREVSTSGSGAYANERMLVLYPRSGDPLTRTLPLTVTALSFSPSGDALAAADASGAVQLLRTQDGTQLGTYQAGAAVKRLEFSPNGTLLGALGDDGYATIWRIGAVRPLTQLAVAADDVRLIVTADDQLAIIGGPHGVTFFRIADGARLRALPVGAEDLTLGPRRRVLALLHGGQVQLWGVP